MPRYPLDFGPHTDPKNDTAAERYPLEFGAHLDQPAEPAPKIPVFVPVMPTLLGGANPETIGNGARVNPINTGPEDPQMAQSPPPGQQSAEPTDNSCYYLKFDGRYLRLHDGDKIVKEWPAVSGKENFGSPLNQDKPNYGPIPEGTYDIKQKRYQEIGNESVLHRFTRWPGGTRSWGSSRVWADPTPETVANGLTFGRKDMAIHGGDSPGSAGCIDLTHQMDDFAKTFRGLGRDLRLYVDYTPPSP